MEKFDKQKKIQEILNERKALYHGLVGSFFPFLLVYKQLRNII